MTDEKTVQFTFALTNPSLDDDERLKFAKKLLPELRDRTEVERAYRTEDLAPEAGSKGFATLVGVLTAEVSFKNVKAFFEFLGDRLVDKPIRLEVKIGEKEVKIEAKSRQELAQAEQTTLKIIEAIGGATNA